jgi:hypothetical protein
MGWTIRIEIYRVLLTDSSPVKVDAVFAHGSDFIRQDPTGKHARLEVTSVLKDKSGAAISYKYSGIINITPAIQAILGGSPDAKTTDFGDACKSKDMGEWEMEMEMLIWMYSQSRPFRDWG